MFACLVPNKVYKYNNKQYSVSLPPVSDVSKQTQLVRACTLSLFVCARKPVCPVSLGARFSTVFCK